MRKIFFFIPLFLWTCGGGGSTEPEPPQLPTVQNINLEGVEDTPITFTLLGTDPQGLSLTYSISTQPENGNVVINNTVGTYTPNANYNGSDTFYYLASNSGGNSNIGTVAINIAAVDDEPNTMDVNVTTDEDNAVSITLQAEEYDGDNIEFNITGNPSNGTVTISGSTATYTPNQDWNGTDTFNFEAVDSNNRSVLNNAIATVIVNPINDAPTIEEVNGIEVDWNDFIDFNLHRHNKKKLPYRIIQKTQSVLCYICIVSQLSITLWASIWTCRHGTVPSSKTTRHAVNFYPITMADRISN